MPFHHPIPFVRSSARPLVRLSARPLVRLCSFLMLLVLPAGVRPQGTDRAEAVTERLALAGFENIRSALRNDTLYVGLENRVWRSQARGAAEALRAIAPAAGEATVIALTLLHHDIPVTSLVVPRRQLDDFLAGRTGADEFTGSVKAGYDSRAYRAVLAALPRERSSPGKLDATLGPSLRMRFGNFDRPLEAGFCLAPAIQVMLRRGMTLTAGVLIPLYTNLLDDEEGYAVRPGQVTLNQTFRLPYDLFVSASAGCFTQNRYGFDGEARKFLVHGRITIGGRLGYTGRLRVIDGSIRYTLPDRFTWFADASWRWDRYDLLIKAGYGGFIAGDRGWRADVSRQFGEITAGFYAQRTGGMWNGGFSFIVPLPPRHYGTKGWVRVRPVSQVGWEYRARGLPETGRSYSTGNGMGDWMPGMDPAWIRNRIGREISF